MRRLLGRVGARTGISVGLILLVAAVVAIGRLAGGNAPPRLPTDAGTSSPSVDASVGDDAEVAPSQSSYPDDTAVRSAAETFTKEWLQRSRTGEQWHAALAPLSTVSLAQSLEGVDPLVVPATRIVGRPTITLRSEQYAQVTVPVDTGTVELGLLNQSGDWLVDSLDWQRT
jgi:hypothetical protein